jgi:hypothetical protein
VSRTSYFTRTRPITGPRPNLGRVTHLGPASKNTGSHANNTFSLAGIFRIPCASIVLSASPLKVHNWTPIWRTLVSTISNSLELLDNLELDPGIATGTCLIHKLLPNYLQHIHSSQVVPSRAIHQPPTPSHAGHLDRFFIMEVGLALWVEPRRHLSSSPVCQTKRKTAGWGRFFEADSLI